MRARLLDVAILVAAFVIGTGLGELFGADNTGIAMTIGQLTFAATLVALLLLRR